MSRLVIAYLLVLMSSGCTSPAIKVDEPDLAEPADLANADMGLEPSPSPSPSPSPTPSPTPGPVVRSKPVWIGSGGSASKALWRLNLHAGSPVGTTTAPSGARLQLGFFPIQTY